MQYPCFLLILSIIPEFKLEILGFLILLGSPHYPFLSLFTVLCLISSALSSRIWNPDHWFSSSAVFNLLLNSFIEFFYFSNWISLFLEILFGSSFQIFLNIFENLLLFIKIWYIKSVKYMYCSLIHFCISTCPCNHYSDQGVEHFHQPRRFPYAPSKSSLHGLLSCFQNLVIVDKTVTSICVQVCWWTFILISLAVELLSHGVAFVSL